ncbi:MAG: MarR family transcriptional regulator [Xanthobacteraceae bacterium]
MTIPAADRVLADDEALAWLRRQAGGRIEITGAELARRWGWNRTKVYRRVRRWAEQGVISRPNTDDGRWLITPVVDRREVGEQDSGDRDAGDRRRGHQQ